MAISIVGVDLSKSVFQLSIADSKHHVVDRKRLSRTQFHRFLAQTGPVRLVMEACGVELHYPTHSTTRRQSGWAGGRAVTGYIGVFGVYSGFLSEKPRPGNPCRARAAGNYRGIRGFISTTGKFLKMAIEVR